METLYERFVEANTSLATAHEAQEAAEAVAEQGIITMNAMLAMENGDQQENATRGPYTSSTPEASSTHQDNPDEEERSSEEASPDTSRHCTFSTARISSATN